MTNTPENLRKVRQIYQRYTNLPSVSLGIQHFSPQGGGYHEGDDLLSQGGRLTTDYSKRESALDRNNRVDVNDACAIDIGWFDVRLPNGRRVTLRDRSRWVLEHWDEAPFLRELIYSTDGKTVKRKDRLGKRTSGDLSHTTHDHESYFRSMVRDPRIPAFHQRFWDDMHGVTQPQPTVKGKATMFACTYTGDPKKAIYVSNGIEYRHFKDWNLYQTLVAKGVIATKEGNTAFNFTDKTAMENAAGTERVES